MNKDILIQEWLDHSKKDLESAEFLTNMLPEPLEIICFHCQQSVEKALKAYISFLNLRPPRTHDLDELIEKCNNDEITTLRDATIPLNDYSVMIRYPSHEELNQNDKNQAINAANAILKLILNLVS
jgi:HEPN domain-containing protein